MGNAGKKSPDLVGIHEDSPVGHGRAVGGVSVLLRRRFSGVVLTSRLSIEPEVRPKIKARGAELPEIGVRRPVGVFDDPYGAAGRFQNPADDAGRRKRMVRMRLPGDKNDIIFRPGRNAHRR
jgi:hypothetical protein